MQTDTTLQVDDMAWADRDNDGDMDLLNMGQDEFGPSMTLFRNDMGSFSDAGAGLTGLVMALLAGAISIMMGIGYHRHGRDHPALFLGLLRPYSMRIQMVSLELDHD